MPKNMSFIVKFFRALTGIHTDFIWEFEKEVIFNLYGFSDKDKQYTELLKKNFTYDPRLYEQYM
jgi:hypothetical protein